MALIKKATWTKFRRTTSSYRHKEAGELTDILMDELDDHPKEIWVNNLYQVSVFRKNAPINEDGVRMIHLSIKNRANTAQHDWRHLQRIKNEIIGPEAEAVELYPAESRLVDGANQYHLWVIENFRFPFGFNTRKISEGNACGVKQRPFEPGFRPDDCVQLTEESYLKELQQELEKAQVAKEQIDGFRIVRRLGVGSNRCADCREATEPDDLFHFEGVRR